MKATYKFIGWERLHSRDIAAVGIYLNGSPLRTIRYILKLGVSRPELNPGDIVECSFGDVEGNYGKVLTSISKAS